MPDIFFEYQSKIIHVVVSMEVFDLFVHYKDKYRQSTRQVSTAIMHEYGEITDETIIEFLFSRVLPS